MGENAELIQLCFIVESLDEAMGLFAERVSAGPWFVTEHDGRSPHSTYRGVPSPLTARIGLAYGGSMMYELVEPTGTAESIFTEHVARHGFGLHHLGFGIADFDGEREARGLTEDDVLFSDRTPRGARVAMIDGRNAFGALEEIIELTPESLAYYEQMQLAARQWDGVTLLWPGEGAEQAAPG